MQTKPGIRVLCPAALVAAVSKATLTGLFAFSLAGPLAAVEPAPARPEVVAVDVGECVRLRGEATTVRRTGGCGYDRVPKDEPLTASYLGGVNGMTVIEIEGDTLKGHFLAIDGKRRDSLQIRKSKP